MTPSQADRLRLRIQEDILSFRLKPGERLDESKLAEKYGTSRTPVREALRQLSSNGLIELRPHKGAIVTKLGIRELIELFEVLAELEGACARLAAKGGVKSDIEAVSRTHEALRTFVERNDANGYRKAAASLHEAINAASRNESLIKLTANVRNRVAPYRRLQLDQMNRLFTSYQELKNIVRAIEQGLPEEADRLMQSHILSNSAEVRRLISLISSAEFIAEDDPQNPSRKKPAGCTESAPC